MVLWCKVSRVFCTSSLFGGYMDASWRPAAHSSQPSPRPPFSFTQNNDDWEIIRRKEIKQRLLVSIMDWYCDRRYLLVLWEAVSQVWTKCWLISVGKRGKNRKYGDNLGRWVVNSRCNISSLLDVDIWYRAGHWRQVSWTCCILMVRGPHNLFVEVYAGIFREAHSNH